MRWEADSAASTGFDPKAISNVSAHSQSRVRKEAALLFGAIERELQN
jgi:hypothetical protein